MQKIRNNLRMLLIRWAQDQWSRLKDEQKKIDRDNSGRPKQLKEFTDAERERFIMIRREMNENMELVKRSICMCSSCSAPDKDMTYNPVTKEWFCVDCYRELQDFYKDKQESFMYP